MNEEKRIENEELEVEKEGSCRMRPERKKSASSSTAIHPISSDNWNQRSASTQCFDNQKH